MNRHAVLITVLFALVVSFITISTVFWEFYKLNKEQYLNHMFAKHTTITQIYKQHQHEHEHSSTVMLEANLAVYNFTLLKNSKINEISKNGKLLKIKGSRSIDNQLMLNDKGFYTKQVVTNLRSSMFEYKNKIYFYIQTPKSSLLVQDDVLKPYSYFSVLYTYSTVLLILSIAFVLVLKKLQPLIRLRRKIAKYGNGNMNISFKMDGEDEIAAIANELEATKCKINDLLESRTLFLRNIMHELKTPITKGTIATQMLKTKKQRDRFSSIFGRLESLVNEFALIEEVTSLSGKTDFKEYRIVDIIDGAIDMAMLDDDCKVEVMVDSNVKIYANYRLYTTAIKNMIDNGIKYSPNAKVRIKMINGELSFESEGECLKYPLEYYIEPFTKENPSKNSFGLGLYLVDSILKVHDKVLAHEYDNGINRFIFA